MKLPGRETAQIARTVLAWLNTCPAMPRPIQFEYLEPEGVCMALATVPDAYKTARFVTGAYLAQYRFKVIYRMQPSDNEDRLAADETLNALADWAVQPENRPDLGEALCRDVRCDARSSILATREDGSEDRQILMTVTYKARGDACAFHLL